MTWTGARNATGGWHGILNEACAWKTTRISQEADIMRILVAFSSHHGDILLSNGTHLTKLPASEPGSPRGSVSFVPITWDVLFTR
jgi:hypothetical protein